jgi:hypothetical protein
MRYMIGFAKAVLVYTPTLSLPLEARGRAPLGARGPRPNLIRSCSAFMHCCSVEN